MSYNDKHNEANGEENRDGNNHNLSWNHGHEGPTNDPEINALRERQKRNLLATLFLSQGIPMLLAGDERGRTQLGNNNAYCQDNETFWLDWSDTPANEQLLAFTRRLIALRHAHPNLRRRDFFQGRPLHGAEVKDIQWLKPDGSEMTDDEWDHHYARSLGVYLSGAGLNEIDRTGQRVRDDDFLILFNAHHDDVPFTLPVLEGAPWHALLDTAGPEGRPDLRVTHAGGETYVVKGRSLALLIRPSAAA